MNGEYIRKMSPEQFYELALPYLKEAVKRENIDLKEIAELIHTRTEVLNDIPEMVDFIDTLPEYSTDLYTHKKMKTNPENSKESLEKALPVLESIENWTMDEIHEKLFALIAELEVKNGLILWPIRVAVSGKAFTPGGGVELAAILGKEETIKRIKTGIELLSK